MFCLGIKWGPGAPNLFFHPDLIQCCPVASQEASEWSQSESVVISLVTELREIPRVSSLCFSIPYSGQPSKKEE